MGSKRFEAELAQKSLERRFLKEQEEIAPPPLVYASTCIYLFRTNNSVRMTFCNEKVRARRLTKKSRPGARQAQLRNSGQRTQALALPDELEMRTIRDNLTKQKYSIKFACCMRERRTLFSDLSEVS